MDMSVWYLMGAALVFFMQCGFAMVEAGFTRSKNTGNITMKNLMDFCIGTVAFYLLGYNILCGDGKFVGWGLNPLKNFGTTDWSNFVFNLCNSCNNCIWSNGRAYQVHYILYLQFCNQPDCISGRSTLGMGRNSMAYRPWIYRFRRFCMYSYGRWNYRIGLAGMDLMVQQQLIPYSFHRFLQQQPLHRQQQLLQQ